MKREERALRVAIGASVVGASLKLGVGLATGALSLISSAVDSLGDILLSLANLFIVRFADAAPDEDHNYGHAKAEGLGAMFEGGFIGAAGLFVGYHAVKALLQGATAPASDLAIATMIPVLALTAATVWYMRRVADETGSLVLRADALHYASDVGLNLGVLASLLVARFTGWSWVDGVVSLGIAGWMIRASWQVAQEGVDVLLDRSLPPDAVADVSAIVQAAPGVLSFHDLRTRGGRHPLVDVHVVVDPATTAQELHTLHLHLLAACQARLGDAVRILLHADPEGEDDHAGDDVAAPVVG
jgi:ferrous-iron efflux pump FieF